MNYKKPDVAVDVVLLALIKGRLHVALKVRESDEPPEEKGKLEVTGGYVHTDEDRDDTAAALRTLHTKLDFTPRYMEQFHTEANDHRDPRGWSVSIVHLAVHDADSLTELVTRRGMALYDVEDDGAHLPENMAFDHRKLVALAVAHLRAKAAYTTIVAHFLPSDFTITELQDAYAAVRQKTCNAQNFRRKILVEDVIFESGMLHSGGRPATGYRLKEPLSYFKHELY